MEFKRNDKVVSSNGRKFTVLADTSPDSPEVELLVLDAGKYLTTVATKDQVTKDVIIVLSTTTQEE